MSSKLAGWIVGWIATAVLVAGAAVARPGAQPGAQKVLDWQGRRYALDDLPALGDAPRATVEAWGPFALEHGYRLVLDDAERVLLVLDAASDATRRAELAAQTIALFDRELPRAPSDPAASDDVAGSAPDEDSDGDTIPEDPEGPPPGWEPPAVAAPMPDYTWGAGSITPDAETIVLFVLKDMEDYNAVLDVLAETQDYLAQWVEEARGQTGFVLEQPLAGAYVLAAAGQEEWNPENELVNRMAQLCLLRRFGQQPNWLVQGYAWHAEFEVLGGVYCFPYRDGFVSVGEHGGWDKVLRSRLKDRGKDPLDFEEFARWPRGTYEDEASRYAWGVVDWVLREQPAALSLLLDDLRRFRDEHNRKKTSDTSWERIQGYKIPTSRQRKIAQKRLGKSFLRELTEDYADR